MRQKGGGNMDKFLRRMARKIVELVVVEFSKEAQKWATEFGQKNC